ncbi:MAG TPA: lamin tail domain-containing protein [Anaerohalosphaeraceae bacterium]|nr:lamin tail domain-containing protein [Anaerohalosphaeraceae bacterium]
MRKSFLDIAYLVLILAIIIGSALGDCPSGDITGDCIVDIDDLFVAAENWLSSQMPLHSGLIAHWGFDEQAGETAADSAGGHTGQLYGEPQWVRDEEFQREALIFDGVDDYIEVPDYKGIAGTASRTCTAWIKTSKTNSHIINWGLQSQEGGMWAVLVGDTGALRVQVSNGYIYGVTNIADGEWHHIAVVLQGDGSPDISEAMLFVDGLSETSIGGVLAKPVNTVTSENVKIGVNILKTAYLQGRLDEVQIYNQALREDEILRLYQTGNALTHNPDFTGDGRVDTEDFIPLSDQWLRAEPAVIISEFLASNDAANPPDISQGQIRDGNGESSDWIELYNQTDFPIALGGWGLTDNAGNPLKWQFPSGTVLSGHSYLIVFASGKEQSDYPSNYPYVDPQGFLHTNFKLSADGEYLALTRPDGTVEHAYDSVLNTVSGHYGFPPQEKNISYGMLHNEEYFFALPSPGQSNRKSFLGFVEAPEFSHERGFYETSFWLTLNTSTPDAVIRYTTNGTDPTLSNGTTYTGPIAVSVSTSPVGRCIRAAAFKPGYQASPIKTRTYLMKATEYMKGLPAVCLSGSPTQVFYNPNGIMAIVGGTWVNGVWQQVNSTDYNNVLGHGMDYERPVSMEYIRRTDGTEFQEDCGIRVHGSAWMRPRYTIPSVSDAWYGTSKYSLRLYFRSRYGDNTFAHPILEQFPEVDEMDTFVLRAGHNDQTNPFVRDEMIRRLQYQMGNQTARGTFVNLYINGVYKGYYNLCERINEDYCQKWFNSDKPWDVVGWVATGYSFYLEARDGDTKAFEDFINYAKNNNLANPLYYAQVEQQMDMPAFVDYIIVQTWGGNWDWPQNNWTAAAERSAARKWRFFVWDAEGCMDGDTSRNRFSNLNTDNSPLSVLYRALSVNQDFKILFADRLQKHFLDAGGAMTQANLKALFWQLAGEVKGVIPDISTYIPNTYIPVRESIYFTQCRNQDLFKFAAPRVFLYGREIQKDYALPGAQITMQNADGVSGDIYYTLDGKDPRLTLVERANTATTTLVAENASKRVLVPTKDIGTTWTQVNYDDSLWNDGLPADNSKTGGVGYERNPGEATSTLPYVSYNVESKMYNNYTSAYVRIPFIVDAGQMQSWNYLSLKMRYDDGFVAYINGTEVCRVGISGTPAWNSTAPSHENSSLETFIISNYLYLLQPGLNILAIHGANYSKNSSDFLVSAILEAGYDSANGIAPSAQKYTGPISLSKSVHIKARTLSGTQWGALREAFVSVGTISDNLRISEFLYNPDGDPNEEFIELTNIGTTPLNLNQVSFTKGIQYTFGDTVINPGQYLLLAADKTVFENRYGTGLPVVGEYAGKLDNAGETIQISDILGNPIQTVNYKDSWYEIADSDGFSLTAVDPAYEIPISSDDLAAHWKFDETTGTTVYDMAGLHHGTIYNMQDTARVYGAKENALLFDGTNDYIAVGGYKGISGSASRTCTAWIRTGTVMSQIISWGELQTGRKWAVRVNDDGTLRAEVQEGYIYGTTPVADNQWHHVAVVLIDDGSPDISEAILYVDGKAETTFGGIQARAVNTAAVSDVLIGVNLNGTVFFQGLMDDLRIYSRALTADEIAAMIAQVNWDSKDLWRPSAVRGGTPGRDETPTERVPLPGAIVINELLAHSHAGLPDWIELYNTTNQAIDISGWFLSDSFSSQTNRKKYRIPDGTILTPANPYYVLEETAFNNISDAGCRIPFALSEGGDTLYLQSANGEELTGYFTKEEFGATASGVTLGRFQKSTGTWNFVPMSVPTKGADNAYPLVGPVIITEIMYNPGPNPIDQDYEFLELMNISSQPVRTASYMSTYTSPDIHIEEWIPWRFTNGIEFEFPLDLQLEPGQRILLVKKLSSFNSRYTGVPAGTVIFQWTSGSLANEGETLQLAMAGDQEYQKERYYIREDRVNYDDQSPWPTQANGTGLSLTHLRPMETGNNYTNDPVHWKALNPTPGW